jgi:hypothetical protein|tara:strand:+ start:1362 stop:1742 length:381 start_codon:yes stop_codon:yes gene_type:complete
MDSWERLQSEFSGDVNYLNRLNVLLYAADEAALDLDAHSWLHTLIVLFRELSTEFEKGEEETGDKFIEEISPLVNTNSRAISRKGTSGIDPKLYQKLHKFEMFIRGILKSSGLQNKMKDDASGALR